MEAFSLKTPIKGVLKNVLDSYPGGQLVSEALQNAEDIGASEFTLLLDLRTHGAEVDSSLRGPAFLLIDDGTGFGDREWTSLMNLHSSEKRNAPAEIGRYGMGSRSYFHYSDVTTVISRGKYVGVDPLEVVTSHSRSRGGWKVDLQNPAAPRQLVEEARQLAELPSEVTGDFDAANRGSLFRLPLRRAEDVAREEANEDAHGALGPEFTVEKAESQLQGWAEQLPKLLLFVASVRRLSIWRWANGAAAPERLALVEKSYVVGAPYARLPSLIPEAAKQTYKTLREHVLSLREAECSKLSEINWAVINLGSGSSGSRKESKLWLVAQRFDAVTPALKDALRDGCEGVPVVGLALPMSDEPLAGSPFCYLPIGGQGSGLPVHLHGSFALMPNRRDLWLPSADLDGKHQAMARWNDCLLGHALPHLWLEVLERIGPRETLLRREGWNPPAGTACAGARVLARLPDVSRAEAAWKPCAERLYELISEHELLPHSQPLARWVRPREACGLAAPSEALREQTSRVIEMYAQCPSKQIIEELMATHQGTKWVVDLPAHVQASCAKLSGLGERPLDHIIESIVRAMKRAKHPLPIDTLRPVLLALMQYAAAAYTAKQHEKWRDQLLLGVEWVPTQSGAVVDLASAFAPQEHLRPFRLSQRNREAFGTDDANVLAAAVKWGLKADLSWADCVTEATEVMGAAKAAGTTPLADETVEWATTLLKYISSSTSAISLASPSSGLDPKTYKAQLSKIAFHPAREPCKGVPASWDGATPDGQLCLRTADSLHGMTDAPLVWATAPWAVEQAHCLTYAKLSVRSLVKQITQLAQIGAEGGEEATRHVAVHLLKAATRLIQFGTIDCSGGEAAALCDVAWVPALGESKETGSDELKLLSPSRVAHNLHTPNLWPNFGRLLDDWRGLTLQPLLTACGVRQHLSVQMLAKDLQAMAEQSATRRSHGLGDRQVELAVGLAIELASNLDRSAGAFSAFAKEKEAKPALLYVPTSSGKLLPSEQVFLNDAPWHRSGSGENEHELLHDAISQKHGTLLGCSSIRAELARVCEQELAVSGEDFAQSEPLHRRINGLLEKYNDEKDVFVEHYQNCDDAGASEVLFLLDAGSYEAERVVTAESAALQGPSLLLASSRALSDDDLRRIQQLGGSMKRGQFSSAGRFGLGLNSFYHLSDTPQIYAKGLALVVWDPLHTIGDSDGKRYSPEHLERNMPDMLKPFAAVAQEYPTIFRLPLRTKRSEFGGAYDVHKTLGLLQSFLAQAEELLLFTKHVSRTNFMLRSENGVNMFLGGVGREDEVAEHTSRFMQSLPTSLEETVALERTPRQSFEKIVTTYRDGNGGEAKRRWVISHTLTIDGAGVELVNKAYRSTSRPLALLPHGAVALCLDPAEGYAGNVAAFMPIGMTWGGPLVVHGCFAVDDSRKVIQLPDGKRRLETSVRTGDWNQALIEGSIAQSYAALVDQCRSEVSSGRMALSQYFDLIGLLDGDGNTASRELREAIRTALWKRLLASGARFLPVSSPKKMEVTAWLPNGPDTRLRASSRTLKDTVQDALLEDGMWLVWLPDNLQQACKAAADAAGVDAPAALDSRAVCRFLRDSHERVSPATLSSLSTPESILSLLGFVLPPAQAVKGSRPPSAINLDFLHGVPLLLLADGKSAKFADGGTRYWNNSAALLPHAPHLFVDEACSIKLTTASSSMEVVQNACKRLGICSLAHKDLLEHKAEIHAQKCNESQEWRNAFWEFLLADSSQAPRYQDWRVLEVENRDGSIILEPLSKATEVFQIHTIDVSWQDNIRKLLGECGVRVLGTNYNDEQWEVLRDFFGVRGGDEALVDMLTHAMEHVEFSMSMRTAVLSYFASRRQNSSNVLSALRKMPLFLRAQPDNADNRRLSDGAQPRFAERFVRLDTPGTSYLILNDTPNLKHKHATNLMLLNLGELCFLAAPPEDIASLYGRLRVDVQYTLDFVTKRLPDKIESVVAGGGVEATKLLAELKSWACDEASDASKEVVKAVKDKRFVPTQSGRERRKAADVLDPSLPVAAAFHSVLKDVLPSTDFVAAHQGLLRKLGWRDYLLPSLILTCARTLDAAASQPLTDVQIQQSFWLVESIAGHLLYKLGQTYDPGHPSRNKPVQAVLDASKLRIMLTAGGAALTDAQRIERVTRLAHSQDINLMHGLALRSMKGVAMPSCAQLTWTVAYQSMHDEHGQQLLPARPAALAPPQTALHQLVERHSDRVGSCLGMHTRSSSVGLGTMMSHLEKLAQSINSGLRGQFTLVSNLRTDINSLLAAMSARLAQIKAGNYSDQYPPLSSLSALPCLPKELGQISSEERAAHLRDAEIGKYVPIAYQLVAPQKLFWRLSEVTSKQDLLHNASDLLAYRELATALGVRDKPSIADWAACTRDVYENYSSDADNVAILPGDMYAIHAAVHGIGELDAEIGAAASSASVEVFLIAEAAGEGEGTICSSNELLYADLPRLKDRCSELLQQSGLDFVHADIVRARSSDKKYGDALVRRTTLRRMSDVISEVPAAGVLPIAKNAVNQFDLALHALMLEDDFIGAYVALCHPYSGYMPDNELNEVKQRLVDLQILWAENPRSVLMHTLSEAEGRQALDGSERAAHAILDETTLYLSTGQLGGDDTHEFLDELAQKLMRHLNGACPVDPQKSDLIRVLKCWSDPSSIQQCLQTLNVREMSSRPLAGSYEPGDLVPPTYRHHFDNSLHCFFSKGELVAVDRDDGAAFQSEQMQGLCVFAIFMGPAAPDPNEGEVRLTRKYSLWCGDLDENGRDRLLTTHPHNLVYKITRRRQLPMLPPPLPESTAMQASLLGGGGAAAGASVVEARGELEQLAADLTELISQTWRTVKKTLHRLYLTWHPDKNAAPHAARFFNVLRRFEQLYRVYYEASCAGEQGEQGEESAAAQAAYAELEGFVRGLRPETVDALVPVTEEYNEGPQPHTWFAEFERERQQQEKAIQQQQQAAAAAAGARQPAAATTPGSSRDHAAMGRSASPHTQYRAAAEPPQQPRLINPPLADVAWVTAQRELDVARLLHEQEHYAPSIFHSHQAAEQVIKAVMLRTCGVTGEEFRGAAGHNLAALLQQLPSGGAPAPPEALERLSRAYLGTRYPAFPPQGTPTLPSAAYSARDAADAIELASRLLEWGRATAQVQSSLVVGAAAGGAAPMQIGDGSGNGGGGGSAVGMSSSSAAEAARRVEAESRASAAEDQVAELQQTLSSVRAEASQLVETTQAAADAEKDRVLEEVRAAHGAELATVQQELKAATERAERLQRALHAMTATP